MKVVAAALVFAIKLRREMAWLVFINFRFGLRCHKNEAAARSQKTVTSECRWRNEAGRSVVICGRSVRLRMAVLVGPLTRRRIFRDARMSAMPRERPLRGLRLSVASIECF